MSSPYYLTGFETGTDGMPIDDIGVAVGDVLSVCCGLSSNTGAATGMTINLAFYESTGTLISTSTSNIVTLTSTPILAFIDGVTIPATTAYVCIYVAYTANSDTVSIDYPSLTKTPLHVLGTVAPGIDFSSNLHANKNLDNIGDTDTYVRQSSQAGQAWVIPNANFINGTAGWTSNSGATLANDNGPSGDDTSQSLKITIPTGNQYTTCVTVLNTFSVSYGDIVNISCSLKSDGTLVPTFVCLFYDAQWSYLGSVQCGGAAPTSWTGYSAQGTAPSGAAIAVIGLYRADAGGSTQTCWLADVSATNLTDTAIDFANPSHTNQSIAYLGGITTGTCTHGNAVSFATPFPDNLIPTILFGSGGTSYSSTLGSTHTQCQQFTAGSVTASGFTPSLLLIETTTTTLQTKDFGSVSSQYASATIGATAAYDSNYVVNVTIDVPEGGSVYLKVRSGSATGSQLYSKIINAANSGTYAIALNEASFQNTQVFCGYELIGDSLPSTFTPVSVTYYTATAPSSASATPAGSPAVHWMAFISS